MIRKVPISREESENVENLFYSYNAYMNMLQYFANIGMDNTAIYDKKWNEASELWIQLDKAKSEVEKKYKPDGEWDNYEFDFNNYQVVFIKK